MKRLFDIVISFVSIIILLPLLIVVGIMIWLDSEGGVFYCQKRVGRNNKDFTLYKFRTMRTHSDAKQLITIGDNDPRITRTGKWLRKYKIDELPQLVNVLIGDMSIVGPRPEVRKYVELYTPQQMRVLSVRPGLSDAASIKYRNENQILAAQQDPENYYINVIMPDKLNINLEYISNHNLSGDFMLIIETIKVILH